MLRLDLKIDITLIKKGWQDAEESDEQCVPHDSSSWVEDSTQSFWNVHMSL